MCVHVHTLITHTSNSSLILLLAPFFSSRHLIAETWLLTLRILLKAFHFVRLTKTRPVNLVIKCVLYTHTGGALPEYVCLLRPSSRARLTLIQFWRRRAWPRPFSLTHLPAEWEWTQLPYFVFVCLCFYLYNFLFFFSLLSFILILGLVLVCLALPVVFVVLPLPKAFTYLWHFFNHVCFVFVLLWLLSLLLCCCLTLSLLLWLSFFQVNFLFGF
jgi:hypothetical protein